MHANGSTQSKPSKAAENDCFVLLTLSKKSSVNGTPRIAKSYSEIYGNDRNKQSTNAIKRRDNLCV